MEAGAQSPDDVQSTPIADQVLVGRRHLENISRLAAVPVHAPGG